MSSASESDVLWMLTSRTISPPLSSSTESIQRTTTLQAPSTTATTTSTVFFVAMSNITNNGSSTSVTNTASSATTVVSSHSHGIRPFANASSIVDVVVADELLWGYIGVCCVLGIVLNMIVVWSLLRNKCNGTLYFLLQISLCDIVSLFVAVAELLYIQQQRWTLPAETCPVYLGLESFSSIATVYLLIALNLHAISTYNLARRTMLREDRLAEQREEQLHGQREQYHQPLLGRPASNPLPDDANIISENSNDNSSADHHYAPILSETPLADMPAQQLLQAPTNSTTADDGYEKPLEADPRFSVLYESSSYHQQGGRCATRSLLIDYSRRKTSVSVVLPVLFVWFLAASASTPLFAFGSVLPSLKAPLICGVVNFDPDNNRLLQAMILAVRVILPTGCLLLSGLAVAWTLCASRTRIRPCGLDENVRDCLRMALVLSAVFVVVSEQRTLGSQLFEVWSLRPLMLPKYPRFDGATALTLSAVHWAASVLRPLVYWTMDETVRFEMRRALCWLPCGTAARKRRRGTTRSRFLDDEGGTR